MGFKIHDAPSFTHSYTMHPPSFKIHDAPSFMTQNAHSFMIHTHTRCTLHSCSCTIHEAHSFMMHDAHSQYTHKKQNKRKNKHKNREILACSFVASVVYVYLSYQIETWLLISWVLLHTRYTTHRTTV